MCRDRVERYEIQTKIKKQEKKYKILLVIADTYQISYVTLY